MLSRARRLLGTIKVEETPEGQVEVSGLPADIIQRDIYRIWNTSRVGNFMFTHIGHSDLSFASFFAPDVDYTFSTIIEHPNGWANIRAMRRVVEELRAESWLKNVYLDHPDILDYKQLDRMKVTLLPNQTQFLERYNHNVPRYKLRGFVLSMPAGTGKTIAGLALATCLKVKKTIIVSPKHAVYKVWQATVNSVFKQTPKVWIAADGKPIDNSAEVFIFHYEALDMARHWAKGLAGQHTIVILDESHNLNEITAARTQYFVELCHNLECQHVIWSSGTSFKAMGSEAIPMMRTLDPFFNPGVEERFRKIYGRNADRAKDILRNRLGLISFRVDKATVVDNKVQTHDVNVVIPNGEAYTLHSIRQEMVAFITQRLDYYQKNMKAYQQFYLDCMDLHEKTLRSEEQRRAFSTYKQYIQLIRRGYDPVLMKQEALYCNQYELQVIIPSLPQPMRADFKDTRSVIKYVQLKVQGECLGRILGKRRSQCHVDMVPYCGVDKIIDGSEKKTVIFSSFVEVVDKLRDHLTAKGYKPLVVYGDTNKNLNQIISQFADDIDANPLIATYQSLSTAVPLVMANTAIMMNAPFRDYEYEQATSRVNRLGQDAQVHIWNMKLDTGKEGNISTRSHEILAWSKEQVDAILGISTPELQVTVESVGLTLEEHLGLKPVFEHPRSLSW